MKIVIARVFIILKNYTFRISINNRKGYLCFHLIPMYCDKHILKQNWFLCTNSIDSSVTTGRPSQLGQSVVLWADQYLGWSCKFFESRQEEAKNMAGGLETAWIFYCSPSLLNKEKDLGKVGWRISASLYYFPSCFLQIYLIWALRSGFLFHWSHVCSCTNGVSSYIS